MAMIINTAMILSLAVGMSYQEELMRSHASASPRAARIEKAVAEVFRHAGWAVRRESEGADLRIRKAQFAYAVEVKAASEGRADRLVPLMAQAILQVRSYTSQVGDKPAPLAVVAAPRIAPRVAEQIREFARAHAPEVAIGMIDLEGLREFSGPGLESLNARAVSHRARDSMDNAKVDLFTDLNQWLIKVLLAPEIGNHELLHAPVGHYRNASDLAQGARVSIMTAFRFLRQLAIEGFIHESSPVIRLVRLEELLRRWQAAAVRPVSEMSARWILPGEEKRVRFQRALSAHSDRACIALFAAADALKLGFVHGAPTHIYVADLHPRVLSQMGLIRSQPGQPSDVFVRVPLARESVFRGAVTADGLRVCDALQVWLDVANHPSRGKEQAQIVFNRVIKPMIDRARHADR
jgi:hypothetical protein